MRFTPQGEEWWWIWVFVTVIEFGWMFWLHQSQNKISADIKETPSEVIVVETVGEILSVAEEEE